MAVDPSEITPTIEQVASRIRARTRGRLGGELGTFNGETTPNAEQAQVEIDAAARFVALRMGRPGTSWDGDLYASATDAVAARAALKIELGYHAGAANSSAAIIELSKVADDELGAVLTTCRGNQVGGVRIHSIPVRSAARRRA